MTLAEYSIDITAEVCPMTYVRTKLALEEMAPGELLRVRLGGGEPLDNVPRTLQENGHEVLALTETSAGVFELLVRKGPER